MRRCRRPDPIDLPGIYEGPDFIPFASNPVREWNRYIADLEAHRATYLDNARTRAAFDREIEYSREMLRQAETELRGK